jgi:hypothetical protein
VLFEQIRRERRLEPEVSVRELARRFGTHRRTVRDALKSATPPPRKPMVRPSPVLDVWNPTIDAWLDADGEALRKQRHTARRVWQRLVDEHHADVGESTVRRYVAEVRRRQPAILVEVKVPQWHPRGAEAEVDSGQVGFWLDGVLTDAWMFVFRLSASGKGFHRVYLNQAQQAFLDGHVRAFEHVGGVPGGSATRTGRVRSLAMTCFPLILIPFTLSSGGGRRSERRRGAQHFGRRSGDGSHLPGAQQHSLGAVGGRRSGHADESGWDDVTNYSTIQTAVASDQLYLLARADAGIRTYRFDEP